jgi:hypothetical protein
LISSTSACIFGASKIGFHGAIAAAVVPKHLLA